MLGFFDENYKYWTLEYLTTEVLRGILIWSNHFLEFSRLPFQNLQSELKNSAERAHVTGEALLSLQDPSTDMAAVRSQMDALSSRVDALKGKMTRFEEHYDEHMRKANEFQLAVERLLAKFGGKKEELLAIDIDTTDGQAVKKRLEELEVNTFSLTILIGRKKFLLSL